MGQPDTDALIAPHTTMPRIKNRYVPAIYLFISLVFHAAGFLMLLDAYSPPRQAVMIPSIDISDITVAHPAESPEQTAMASLAATPLKPVIEHHQEEHNSSPTENTPTDQTAAKEITGYSPLELAMARGYFKSLSDGRTLRDDIRTYYYEMLEKINERWWLRVEGLGNTDYQDGVIEIFIRRDGAIIDARLAKSTGAQEVDQAIMEVLAAASPLPPLPGSYFGEVFQAPLRIAAPSHFFKSGMRR